MIILKIGTLPEIGKERVMIGTCGHCGSIVSFMESEAKMTYGSMEGMTWGVSCPTKGCGRTCDTPLQTLVGNI